MRMLRRWRLVLNIGLRAPVKVLLGKRILWRGLGLVQTYLNEYETFAPLVAFKPGLRFISSKQEPIIMSWTAFSRNLNHYSSNLVPRAFPSKNGWGAPPIFWGKSPGDEVDYSSFPENAGRLSLGKSPGDEPIYSESLRFWLWDRNAKHNERSTEMSWSTAVVCS